jgi:hypothetical protein
LLKNYRSIGATNVTYLGGLGSGNSQGKSKMINSSLAKSKFIVNISNVAVNKVTPKPTRTFTAVKN